MMQSAEIIKWDSDTKWVVYDTVTTLKIRTEKTQNKEMTKINNNINNDNNRSSGNPNQPRMLL
jgi:hypothetical protein